MGNPDLLLSRLLDTVDESEDRKSVVRGFQMGPMRSVRFTAEQDHILRIAARERNLPIAGASKHPGYIRMAALAFMAYDLDISLMSLVSGQELPESDAMIAEAARLSRDARGLWGIMSLGDHQRGTA